MLEVLELEHAVGEVLYYVPKAHPTSWPAHLDASSTICRRTARVLTCPSVIELIASGPRRQEVGLSGSKERTASASWNGSFVASVSRQVITTRAASLSFYRGYGGSEA